MRKSFSFPSKRFIRHHKIITFSTTYEILNLLTALFFEDKQLDGELMNGRVSSFPAEMVLSYYTEKRLYGCPSENKSTAHFFNVDLLFFFRFFLSSMENFGETFKNFLKRYNEWILNYIKEA